EALRDLYDLTLLRMLGCTAETIDFARLAGDELSLGGATQLLDYGDPASFGAWVMSSFAADRPPDVRARMLERLFGFTPERRHDLIAGHCEVAQLIGDRLGANAAVRAGLAQTYERWDGAGVPAGLRGEEASLLSRIGTVARNVEIHARLEGIDAAVAMAGARS